ncbi:MAG: L-seryl-tRNA(Sec) selenium transferase [Anaerolineales bacterium]|nr:L-seryl-tRNA(Sec) selenium transferase [Anaerolineales bacterium]
MDNPYRYLPSVDRLLQLVPNTTVSHERLVALCRAALDEARATISEGLTAPTEDDLIRQVERMLHEAHQISLRPVINATGVIIHTNLGRTPLSDAALAAMHAVSVGYSNLEYDLDAGQRGKRDTHVEAIITEITGAEAALVVNNNAAAVYLTLSGLALGKEVVISRGELVEIGGGFRIPDVMRQSGSQLVEVGTTNRTRIRDYTNAITPDTAALMRIHSSNFKMIGFTESVTLAELVELAHQRNLMVFDDLGSGTLIDTARFGLDHEPTITESIQAGVDVVTFSGDKLLGGPQAGIIVGKQAAIDRLKHHPMARALRPDKLCISALTTTLRHYRDGEALERIPVWLMIATPLAEIEARALRWQAVVGGEVVPADSMVGGGSLPGNALPSKALALHVDNPDKLATQLREQMPPIIVRIQDGRVLLDPRTVLPEQDSTVIDHLRRVLCV